MKPKIAFCSDHTNPFYDTVLRGVREEADRSGAELVSWQGRLNFPLAAVPYLKPDGLLLGPKRPEDVEVELPCVGFSNVVEHGIRPAVVNDDREAGRMAARAAEEAGYTYIGLLSEEGLWHARLREEGVREEAVHLGLSIQHLDMGLRPVREGETFQEVWKQQQEAFNVFITNLPDNCLVVALGHGHARDALSLLKGILNKRVPEEVGVLLVDLPGNPDGTLAYIRLNGEEVGVQAVRRLLGRLLGEKDMAPEVVSIPPSQLVPGDSCRQGESQKVYKQLREWCTQHVSKSVSVEDICRAVGMSRRSLEMKLKEGGFSAPYEILTDLRVAEAKRLLTTGRLRVEEIAERCGFSDGRALRKRFQAKTQLTPREWRKAMASE